MSRKIKRFDKNENGRDFIVGDIHGCFDALATLLEKVSFNEEADRLFSVGDLVDRGPLSESSLAWLGKPWFHAVRGNHEQMAIDFANGLLDSHMYNVNGGSWNLMNPPQIRTQYADAFDALPYVIEVAVDGGTIGIVHAECPLDDWSVFVEALSMSQTESNLDIAAIWSRDRIHRSITSEIAGVDFVIVGHTPVAEPCMLGNVIYLDTGAVFGRSLTLFCLNDFGFYAEAA